jgi:hypothetical protein
MRDPNLKQMLVRNTQVERQRRACESTNPSEQINLDEIDKRRCNLGSASEYVRPRCKQVMSAGDHNKCQEYTE